MKNGVVAALLVVAILAGAGAGYYMGTSNVTRSNENPQPLFLPDYGLEFVQESNCPYGSWLVPWAVMLNNHTVGIQPSNATLPLSYGGAHLTSDSNYSTIWFGVWNGTYDYTILPKNIWGEEQNGTVTVNGGSVVVQISAFITPFGCSTTSTEVQTSTTATCVQTLSAPLYLIVKDDNGTPIPDQPLTIQAHLLEGFAYNTTTNECDAIRSTHLWMNETGSDGKIQLGMTGDVFNMTALYLGRTYHVNADADGAESAECVTLSLPSGAVNTTFAGQFKYQC